MPAAQALHNEVELTVAQVAKLTNYNPRHVRRLVDEGTLPGEKRLNERNRPTYYIPLSALDAKQQRRFLNSSPTQPQSEAPVRQVGESPKPLEQFSLGEREQIAFWCELLEEWRQYRLSREGIPKADADTQFVMYATVARQPEYQAIFNREFELTRPTLYRYWRSFRANELDGLVDKRGKATKGKSSIDTTVWQAFLSFYLDQRQYPITRCYEYTQLYIRKRYPELESELPHVASFYRKVERDIPLPVKVLGREGDKAYNDRCSPYIRREMDGMESNEWWVADTHTLDVISDMGDGKTHRLYMNAFFDPRSYTFVGCTISDRVSSQATVATLRKCILKRQAIPTNVYMDNGREYLTFDVGGLGHRAKKKHRKEYLPPPIFQRMGINMVNALPRNAQAKLIERAFLDVKNELSRLFPTFTGGTIIERPEILKYNLKKGKAVADQELTQTVEYLLEWYFNQRPYGGMVVKDKGKTRMQVYEENLYAIRMCSEEDLALLMMRSSRAQTIGRRGVWLKIGDQQFDFFSDETDMLQGKEVYFRYDPEDLSFVRIYDLEDRLLTIAPMDEVMRGKYGSNKEEIAEAMRMKRSYKRSVREILENSMVSADEKEEALDLVIELARENERLAAGQKAKKVSVIELERIREKPLYSKVAGLDIDFMLENAERFYEGGSEDE